VRVALASRQPLSEVQSWEDVDLVTVLQELDELAAARKEAGRGR
jgi:hypothetical protein